MDVERDERLGRRCYHQGENNALKTRILKRPYNLGMSYVVFRVRY